MTNWPPIVIVALWRRQTCRIRVGLSAYASNRHVRETEHIQDRKETALKASDNLWHQVGELYMERSRLETELTGLKAHITEPSSEVGATVADSDRVRQELAVRISREAQIRQILAGWSNDGARGGSGDTASSQRCLNFVMIVLKKEKK